MGGLLNEMESSKGGEICLTIRNCLQGSSCRGLLALCFVFVFYFLVCG